jgi:hypothetical protein
MVYALETVSLRAKAGSKILVFRGRNRTQINVKDILAVGLCRTHNVQPGPLWGEVNKVPFPTNAWWTNLGK